MLTPWKKSYDQPRQHIKKQRHYFTNKGLSSQSYGFPSGHVWMWELDYKESWAQKNQCFQSCGGAGEDSWELKEIKLVHPKGKQSWIFIGRSDDEAETLILWPPDVKSQLTWKDPDAGKDWEQEEKEATEDEMTRQHHWINGHKFEQNLGDSGRQRTLACCSPWDRKESDKT